MSFGIIPRDVFGEWDKSGWSLWFLCIVGSSSSLSEELSSAIVIEWMRRSNINSNNYCFGASWSI